MSSAGNRTSPSAAEARMTKYYNLDGVLPAAFIPSVVTMKVFDNRHDRQKSGGNALPHKLKALDDDLISYGQRERLAAAMLKGNEEPVQASGVGIRGEKAGRESSMSGLDEESTILTHYIGTQRNNVVGPKFLKISSTPVIVNNMHPREVLARERQRQKNLSNHNHDVIYSWGGTTVLPVPGAPSPEKPSHTEIKTNQHPSQGKEDGKKDSTLSATIAKWKAESVHRNKMELKELAKETKEKKQAELEAIESKIKYKKGLTEFRTNLKERLRERKDPLQGSVMRQFDDEFAQNMMEKYEGHSMSVDAVLNMLGAPLGKNLEVGKAVVLPTDHMEMNGSGHLVVAETTAVSGPSWSAVRSKEGSKLRCVAAAAEKARQRLQKVQKPESKYTFNDPMSRQRQQFEDSSQEMGLPLATREGLPGMRQTHPMIRIQVSNERSFGIPPETPLGGLVTGRTIGFNVDKNGDVQLKLDTIARNLGKGKRRNYDGQNEFQVSEKEKNPSVEVPGVGHEGGVSMDILSVPEGMFLDHENGSVGRSVDTGISVESRPISVLQQQLPRQPPPSPPTSAKINARYLAANSNGSFPGTKSKVAFLDMTIASSGPGRTPTQGQGLASQEYNTRGGIGGGFVYGGGGGIGGGDMGMMMTGGVEGEPSVHSLGGQSMTDESTIGGVGNMGFGNVYGSGLIRDKANFQGDVMPHVPSQSAPYVPRSAGGGSSSAGGGRGSSRGNSGGGGMSIVKMGLQTNAMKLAIATAKLPASPYKSDAEAMRIYHSGVPSGGAMRIWPQASRKNNGRYWHGKGPPPINSPNKYLQLPPEKSIVPREGGMRPAIKSPSSPLSPFGGLNASSSLHDLKHAFHDSGKAKSVMNDSLRA